LAKFTFDPAKHTFSEGEQKIINILMEIYENEKHLEQRLKYTTSQCPVRFSIKGTAFNPYLLRIFDA